MHSALNRGRGTAAKVFACAVLIAMILLPMQTAASQPEFIQILEIDDYSKNVLAGGSVSYNWTLRNTADANLTVNVTAELVGSGWIYEIDHSQMSMPVGRLNSTTVILTAPLDYGDTSSNLTLLFSVYEGGFLVQVASVSIVSTVEGVLASADKVLWLWNNPLPSPLDNEWGVFLLDVLIWFAIAAAVALMMDRIVKLITRKTKTMLDDMILRIIRVPILILIFIFGALQSLNALHKYVPEGIRESLSDLYRIVLILVIFYLAYKIFKEVILHYGKRLAQKTQSKVDDVLMPVIEKIGIIVIAMAALGYVLSIMDVDLTMFVAGGVVVSMVFAFAAQETLSNFFSGIFILMDRPFSEGDTVILSDGDWCEIRHIGLRTTRMYRFSDSTMVTLPNNKLVNDKITRVSNVADPARIMATVKVAYGTDIPKAREAIMKAIKSMPYSLLTDKDRQPMVLLDQLTEYSLTFNVIVWLNDSDKRIAASDKLSEEMVRKLSDAGIATPMPQTIVHLKKA